MEKKISFKDVWKGPFKYDGWSYIWASNNVMAFMFDDNIDDSFCFNFAKLLSDKSNEKISSKLEIRDGCDLYMDDVYIGCFRGWGHLCGNLNLTLEEAEKIQDDFINDCLKKIKE